MKLKIIDKLKKKSHKDVALAQDILIDIIYEIFPKTIFHGGTAIWRCYKGTRFSEDIDAYLDKEEKNKLTEFQKKLKEKGIEIIKFKSTNKIVYSKLKINQTEIRFEASFLNIGNKKPVLKAYETLEGNYINIFTFTPENLIKEKVETYLSRYLVRDIYDIYVLLNHVENKNKIKNSLKKLISNYKKPIDESILPSLIFTGAIPTNKQILENIKKWAK
ncbi:MAG: nucleotidyl transferase AbiEii/AbiGii toxin family protein [Nanoarchaeota archaeon]